MKVIMFNDNKIHCASSRSNFLFRLQFIYTVFLLSKEGKKCYNLSGFTDASVTQIRGITETLGSR